ncbi:hypothetical protein BgiBS90_023048 [Biomphalaria glabrata]|nr:hypothetical protein BgiBS90_023048 [Biomphalaria glabrata]
MDRLAVVQFHCLFLNWNLHSISASLAPFATSATTSGSRLQIVFCLPASRFVFLQMLLESITRGLPTALKRR